jgi:geranylgeranyl pyrophosphate synthase
VNNTVKTIPDFLTNYQTRINAALDACLKHFSDTDTRLSEAIRYSTLLGGKRIRPVLVLSTACCFNTALEHTMDAACAVELIHAYSLIHDDLPAMDDDDLRRGQPTCHKAYDEATAILAGDALQSMAFELLSSAEQFSSDSRIKMIQLLSKASGPKGMVLGQAIDFDSVGQSLSLAQLENMHRHKTGALIEASVQIGALTSQTEVTAKEYDALTKYAQAIGLAFQVQDDILDIISDTETLGKTQGADIALNKPTYPALLGLDGAKEKLENLHKESIDALDNLQGRNTEQLCAISDYIISRIK